MNASIPVRASDHNGLRACASSGDGTCGGLAYRSGRPFSDRIPGWQHRDDGPPRDPTSSRGGAAVLRWLP